MPRSRTQMGLSESGNGPDQVWLEPSKGGYAVLVGAAIAGKIGFVQKDGDGSWHVNRLDLMEEGYPSAQAAGTALVEKLRDEGKL